MDLAATKLAAFGDKCIVAGGAARKHSEVTAHRHSRTSYVKVMILPGRSEMNLGGEMCLGGEMGLGGEMSLGCEMGCRILAGSCLSVLGQS